MSIPLTVTKNKDSLLYAALPEGGSGGEEHRTPKSISAVGSEAITQKAIRSSLLLLFVVGFSYEAVFKLLFSPCKVLHKLLSS